MQLEQHCNVCATFGFTYNSPLSLLLFFLLLFYGFLGELPNPCAQKNGGCSHFCVLIPQSPWRSCLCPVGRRLLANNMTCADGMQLTFSAFFSV